MALSLGRVPVRAARKRRSGGLTKKDKYLVALDVGSTKTCAVIGEVDEDGREICLHGRGGIEGAAQGPDRQYRRDGDFDPARD